MVFLPGPSAVRVDPISGGFDLVEVAMAIVGQPVDLQFDKLLYPFIIIDGLFH